MGTIGRTKTFPAGTTADGETHPRYRRDIDGLRAIAVTSVVLFHAGIPGLSGGFVGVDIFFVISGYLIGGIVSRDVARKRFSFATFYARRVRRILPALLFLVLVQCLVALLLMPPAELKHFAVSAMTAIGGVSNIRYRYDTSYFAPSALFDPFLMTWSLGVEEQFYVVLPPLMLALHRFLPNRQLPAMVFGSILSLALSVVLTHRYPSQAFYLLPTRAWELGAGVMLVLWQQGRRDQQPNTMVSEVLGIGGLAAVIASIALFTEATSFPGYAAILPVAGAVALIASERSSVNRRLLGSAPMRGIGLISYSWYLWHWPMMAFARVASGLPPSRTCMVTIALLSLVIGYLSWRFVEQRFRHADDSDNRRLLLRYAGVVAAVFAVPAAIYLLNGLPGRLPPTADITRQVLAMGRGDACLASYTQGFADLPKQCAASGTRPRVALIGDSHAAALVEALREAASRRGMDLTVFTKSSCAPLLLISKQQVGHPGLAEGCHAFHTAAFDAVVRDPLVRTVVLAGRWDMFPDDQARYVSTDARAGPTLAQPELLKVAIADAVETLRAAGKRAIVLADNPNLTFDVPRQSYVRYLPALGFTQTLVNPGFDSHGGWVASSAQLARTWRSETALAAGARGTGATYASLNDGLCRDGRCRIIDDAGQPYYFDSQHLSLPGARHAFEGIGMDRLLAP